MDRESFISAAIAAGYDSREIKQLLKLHDKGGTAYDEIPLIEHIVEKWRADMTKAEAIAAYEKRFGGYPAFLLMGADDDTIIETLAKSLEKGEELTAPDPDADY